MKTVDSLKELERRAYRSTFDDGIYDIQFGLIFLILALIPILQTVGISRFVGYALLIISPMLLPWLGKRFITIPRMGAVEFGPKRKSRRRLLLAIGAAVIILMLPLLIMIVGKGIPGRLGWSIIAMSAAPVLAIAVYFLDFPRLFVYLALLMFAVFESEILLEYVHSPFNTIISLGIPGAIIFAIGLTLLFKFMKKYPKPAPEVNHVSG
jgi:hypothetical protein